MQATVDRVIRSFLSKHPVSLRRSLWLQAPMSDVRSGAVHDETSAFAAQLLENYKGQISRRSLKPD